MVTVSLFDESTVGGIMTGMISGAHHLETVVAGSIEVPAGSAAGMAPCSCLLA